MKKNSKNLQGELVFGVHAIVELIKAKRRKITHIYTTDPEPKAWKEIAGIMPKHLGPQYVKKDVLTRMAGTDDHQGIVAFASPFQFRKKFFDVTKQTFLLMLDGIQDVRNLGAILRSAYCTGVEGVILTEKNSASMTGACIKASAGLAEYMEIYIAPSAKAAIVELKAAGYNIYLTTFDGKDASKVTYKAPLCVVIGNEAIGVSKDILNSGEKITLPQKSSDISYNASVASGISLFLISNQLGKI
ncbi:MAG: RNA methyltransferase, TrmH family, group 3 [candidate division TM6 bacterium GW2011_GWF2_32_72]|nr:MAG: RNA methyltransferase, TrmH family, group 3 [candidate division TM6 bacterium GW2011_GWF2_32_72]